MSASVIFPPPPREHRAPEVTGAAADASWVSRLSTRRYRLLVLLLCALAAALASQGLQRLAAMRANYYLAIDRGGAVSPLSYGVRLPALGALAAPASGGVRAVVRADSAGPGADALCALAAALGDDASVTWITAGREVEPCMRAAGARLAEAGPAARGELARARWLLLGADGTVLHSGRGVPSQSDVRELAALLAPTPAAR